MSKLAEQYTDLDKLRHSCSHVLAQAVKRKYPQAKLGFGPPVEGGFYYDIHLPEALTESDLESIEKEMQKIIESNFSFEKRIGRIYPPARGSQETRSPQTRKRTRAFHVYRAGRRLTDFQTQRHGHLQPFAGVHPRFVPARGLSGSDYAADFRCRALEKVGPL